MSPCFQHQHRPVTITCNLEPCEPALLLCSIPGSCSVCPKFIPPPSPPSFAPLLPQKIDPTKTGTPGAFNSLSMHQSDGLNMKILMEGLLTEVWVWLREPTRGDWAPRQQQQRQLYRPWDRRAREGNGDTGARRELQAGERTVPGGTEPVSKQGAGMLYSDLSLLLPTSLR